MTKKGKKHQKKAKKHQKTSKKGEKTSKNIKNAFLANAIYASA